MEINRQKILTKVGITPIETTQQLQKDIQCKNTQVAGLGLMAAFEAGVIITMGIMGKRKKCNSQCQIGSASRYCDPAPRATDDFCEED